MGEPYQRVEYLSIGMVDWDRHHRTNANFLLLDSHVGAYDGQRADQVSSGSCAPGDYWMTHDDELVWGSFN
jgi:hypothetical protein